MKWKPQDIIALVVILGAIALLVMGRDTIIGWTLIAVVCAYYGIDLTPFVKLGRNQSKKKGEEGVKHGAGRK